MTATSSGLKIVTPLPTEESTNNLLLPNSTKELREEILATPTSSLGLQNEAVEFDFFSPRFIGVVLGLCFLYIYIKNLHQKKN